MDWRGGGRSSARETVGRVAAGAVAKKLLSVRGIDVIAFTRAVGDVWSEKEPGLDARKLRAAVDSNPVRTLDAKKSHEMESLITSAKTGGDSVGGIIEVVALNVPAGLGEPVFNKLDAALAQALMSIPAVKGVEVGAGFRLAGMLGSVANDEFFVDEGVVKTRTNNCGGILGGLSDGMPVVLRVAVKPTSSLMRTQKTVDLVALKPAEIQVTGRHDPCIVPRAVPVVEAMVALVLADEALLSGLIPPVLE